MPTYKGLENFKLLDKMGEYVLVAPRPLIIVAYFSHYSGAFSNVYKAVDMRTGRKVAGMSFHRYPAFMDESWSITI